MSIRLNLHQARQLLEFFGGEDADVTLNDTPLNMHSGPGRLYAWLTEHPEEGSIQLESETACPKCGGSGWKPNLDANGETIWTPLMNDALPCECGALARKIAAQKAASGVMVDRGPWSVAMVDGKPELFSDDFEHDVKLRISGDFADDQQRMNYANALAAQLNAASAALGRKP